MQRLSSLWTTRKGDWLPFTFHWNLRHQMWKWRRLEFLERLNPLKGSWKVCGETQLSGWWGRPEFQEAFPKAFRTFSSSHNRWSYFKQATPRWMQGNRCENVLWGWLGSEEGAYTLHWQAELPGGLGGLGGPGTPRTFLNNWLEPFAHMQYMYIQCQRRLITWSSFWLRCGTQIPIDVDIGTISQIKGNGDMHEGSRKCAEQFLFLL